MLVVLMIACYIPVYADNSEEKGPTTTGPSINEGASAKPSGSTGSILSLTIPSNPLSLDLNPTVNNGFATTSGSFNVKTDNESGYTVSIRSKNDSGDNSLINGNNKLTSITESTSEDNFKSDPKFINMWGWLPNKLNSEDNTNYQVAPGTEEVVLDKTEGANEAGTDYDMTLAAKVAEDTPTGTYTNTFIVTALPNASPQKEYEPTECQGLTVGQISNMTDPRDGTTYKIARLPDGKCWMIENLRIVGKTIDASNSDIKEGAFTIPTSDIAKFVSDNPDNDAVYYANEPEYGAYYTWHTATAGSGTGAMTTRGEKAGNSICPKGWRLPTGGENGEYQNLVMAYGDSGQSHGDAQHIISVLKKASTPAFTESGYIDSGNGTLTEKGSYAAYWSANSAEPSDAFFLSFAGGFTVYPTGDKTKQRGNLVRCVAKGETPKSNVTLQTVDQWGNNVKEGDIILAIDSRDNSLYTVSRLKDDKLWMTQNLHITDKTITSADSDVVNPYTIPASATWTDSVDNADSNHAYIMWYTWYTATAGTGTSSMTTQGQDASGSICPKGWRLPTGGTNTNSDFYLLSKKYTNTEQLINTSIPVFGYIGYIAYNSGLRDQGIQGSYWSSTIYNNTQAYLLSLFSYSNSYYIAGNHRSSGFSVRCIARDEVLDGYTINYEDLDPSNCGVDDVPETQYISSSENSITLSNKNPSTSCFSFKGWCTVKPENGSCSGQVFQPGQSMPLSSDNINVTLYAIWQRPPGQSSCVNCPA